MSRMNGYDSPTLSGVDGYHSRGHSSLHATRRHVIEINPPLRAQNSVGQSTDRLTTHRRDTGKKERSWYKHHSWEEDGPKRSASASSTSTRNNTHTAIPGIDQELTSRPTSYTNSNEGVSILMGHFWTQSPDKEVAQRESNARMHTGVPERQPVPQDGDNANLNRPETRSDFGDITALPSTKMEGTENVPWSEDKTSEYPRNSSHQQHRSPPHSQTSRWATELYTSSYLIFFSILGTLARLGLQWLTFYPGAPVVLGVLWANFAGSLFMGFLNEDKKLFQGYLKSASFDRLYSTRAEEDAPVKHNPVNADLAKVKKTIPLYIGLATGFCGSFTSFSAFMRDVFFALSNDLPSPVNHPVQQGFTIPPTTSTLARNGGYSFMAVLAVVILTVSLCISSFKFGSHLAIFLRPLTPILSKNVLCRILDRGIVVLGWGSWLGAILMAIWPPDRVGGPSHQSSSDGETWRGQAIFACVFAPLGCLLRYYASSKLNGVLPSFPLGTFAVNMVGTAVLGMAYDLQNVRLGSGTMDMIGGGRTGCQVLQGIMDGFDGCLTTVSTWVAELVTLRKRHAYVYGVSSVLVGLGLLVAIMGSVRWSIGWQPSACVT